MRGQSLCEDNRLNGDQLVIFISDDNKLSVDAIVE